MPYSAVLHATIGTSRGAKADIDMASVGAVMWSPVLSRGQICALSHASARLAAARAKKTLGQPTAAPATPPIGAPIESDTNSPETTTASHVARRSSGAM